MAQNTTPGFTAVANIASALLTAANTRSDGNGTIGTDIFLVFTAPANGSYIEKVRLILTGTVAGTGSGITVARIYLSTKTAGATTSADTYLWAELALNAQTADSATVPVSPLDVPLRFRTNLNILASVHAAPVGNTAWRAVAIGGDY